MTTIYRSDLTPGIADEAIAVEELRLPMQLSQPRAVEQRRAAFARLDAMVRRQLVRAAPGMFPVVQPATIYDAVYTATPEIGGHWSVASTAMALFMHSISSYTVALAFDEEQQPDHFVVSGAREFVSDGVSEAALAAALLQKVQGVAAGGVPYLRWHSRCAAPE